VILRRRGDYANVMRELGTLFAREGEVDKYFQHKTYTPQVVSISKDDLKSHGWPDNPTKEQFISYLDREIFEANVHIHCHEALRYFGFFLDWKFVDGEWKYEVWPLEKEKTNLAPVSEAELLDLTNSFGLVRAEYPGKLIDTDRVKNRVLIHLRFAEEREAAALLLWASGYCDGLDRALRISRNKE
jgi:hypothetical protein